MDKSITALLLENVDSGRNKKESLRLLWRYSKVAYFCYFLPKMIEATPIGFAIKISEYIVKSIALTIKNP